MHRASGTVKWFNRIKGYGFILSDNGEQEIFVHYSAIDGEGYRNLYEGDRVEFDLVDMGKGPQARNVVIRRTQGVPAPYAYFMT
jgi:CspA family cold shock protein